MLEFFSLNSKPGDPALGTMDLVDGKLVDTGCATELSVNMKKRMTDGEIYAKFADDWTNGYYYTVMT